MFSWNSFIIHCLVDKIWSRISTLSSSWSMSPHSFQPIFMVREYPMSVTFDRSPELLEYWNCEGWWSGVMLYVWKSRRKVEDGVGVIRAIPATITSFLADTRGGVGAEAGECSSCWPVTFLSSSAFFDILPKPSWVSNSNWRKDNAETVWKRGVRTGMWSLE